ncbi:uncharacterized protein LOC144452139 [Glandiceps talaboti]
MKKGVLTRRAVLNLATTTQCWSIQTEISLKMTAKQIFLLTLLCYIANAEYCPDPLRTSGVGDGFHCPRYYDMYEETYCCGDSSNRYCCNLETYRALQGLGYDLDFNSDYDVITPPPFHDYLPTVSYWDFWNDTDIFPDIFSSVEKGATVGLTIILGTIFGILGLIVVVIIIVVVSVCVCSSSSARRRDTTIIRQAAPPPPATVTCSNAGMVPQQPQTVVLTPPAPPQAAVYQHPTPMYYSPPQGYASYPTSSYVMTTGAV